MQRALGWFFAALLLASLPGCQKGEANPRSKVTVKGAGATFPAPLYEKWAIEYGIATGTRILYQAVGSTRGIEAITTDSADFGASDAPMTPDQISQAGGDILQIPTTLSAVAIVYNLRGVPNLKLTGEALSGIASGEITTWNHPKIAQANSEVPLPDAKLRFVRRTDGSGTTTVLTQYLSLMSDEFRTQHGVSPMLKAPGSLEAEGNSGVAELVARTEGSVSYVALNYARANNLQTARLFGANGAFVAPSLDSVTAAASKVPDDLTASIVNSAARNAYPISSFSYLLVHRDGEDCERRSALRAFLHWVLHDGQAFSPFLHYGALPRSVVQRADLDVSSLRCAGRPLPSP
jgi:phosphate transport system substrate-binding protein